MGCLPTSREPAKPVRPPKPISFRLRRIIAEARRERLASDVAEKMTPELKQENRIQNA
jgi:hypothetical protein